MLAVPLRPLPRAIALWSYSGKSSTEMSFEKDEIITVEAELPGEWWRGRIADRKGHFPKNYVQMLPSDLADSNAPEQPQSELGAIVRALRAADGRACKETGCC